MSPRLKISVAFGLVAILIGLGVTDALLTVEESPFVADVNPEVQPQILNEEKNGTSKEGPKDVKKEPPAPGGTRKQEGTDVGRVLAENGFVFQEVKEPIFLSKIIPNTEAQVTGAVLMKDDDRAGIIAWADSSKVKIYFLALKEALHGSFTTAIKDLVDETQRREGKPTRNFLTFLDTGISEERIVFVRVRERLYEIHIAEGKDKMMFKLIDTLTE